MASIQDQEIRIIGEHWPTFGMISKVTNPETGHPLYVFHGTRKESKYDLPSFVETYSLQQMQAILSAMLDVNNLSSDANFEDLRAAALQNINPAIDIPEKTIDKYLDMLKQLLLIRYSNKNLC